MNKKSLLSFLFCLSGLFSSAYSAGMYGATSIYNDGKYEDYEVKLGKASSLVVDGDIIEFKIREKTKGKLGVSKVEENILMNTLTIKGYDLTNKINRKFEFLLFEFPLIG